MSRFDKQEDDFWMEVLAITGMISVALLIAIVFWYGIHTNLGLLGISKAEGTEVVDRKTVSSDDVKWNSLLLKYPQVTLPIKAPDWTKVSISAGQDSRDHKPANDVEDVQNKKLEAVKSFIRYANPKLKIKQVDSLADSIVKWADFYNLPVGLVVGVTHAESNFKATAQGILVQGHRAIGPMQVMWPMHQDLAKRLGVPTKQAMFGDLGVKVGCYILKTYIKDEQSVIGGLKRYLATLSKVYILEKVMTGWIAVEQLTAGTITEEELKDTHITEKNYMRRLTARRK